MIDLLVLVPVCDVRVLLAVDVVHVQQVQRGEPVQGLSRDIRVSARCPEHLCVQERRAAEIRAQARAEYAELIATAETPERLASGEDATGLQTNLQHETTGDMEMTVEHRRNLSAARADDPLSVAMRAAGFAGMRALAASVGVSPTLLSQAHKGKLPIKQSVALRVESALGKLDKGKSAGKPRFPATEKHWPRMVRGK